MTLLITLISAVCATAVWYFNSNRDKYKLGTLSLMYWGAGLMWFVDFVFEYAELKADYFVQEFTDILNDTLLGITVVVLGMIIWLAILIIKDPNKVIEKKLTKN